MPERESWAGDFDSPKGYTLDQFLEEIEERDTKAQGYMEAWADSDIELEEAQPYRKMVDSERLAKTELLQRSGLIDFINSRCSDKNFTLLEGRGTFSMDGNSGSFRNYASYPMVYESGERCDYFKPEITKLIDILKAIGVPEGHIQKRRHHEVLKDEQGKIARELEQFHYLSVPVNRAVITGLIDNAVEDEFASIQKQIKELDGQPDELRILSRLLGRITGKLIVDFSSPDNEKIIKEGLRERKIAGILGPLARKPARREERLD